MDEKKKRAVYITIIVLCVLGTIGIIFAFSSSTPPAEEPSGFAGGPVNTVDNTATATSAAGAAIGQADFPIPSVFPADDKFMTSALNSNQLQTLNNYDPLTVSPTETIREDPFARY